MISAKILKTGPGWVLSFFDIFLDFPEADVVSVEADPDIFSQLEYLEEFDITVLQFAITDIDGEIDFYQSAVRDINSGEINLRSQKKAPVGSQLISTQTIKNHNNHLVYESSIIRVPAIRIDTLAKEVLAINTIDYMHVDTQGTFLYVVRGMGELRPKLIFAEVGMDKRYIGGDKIEETDQFMHELGYRKIRSSDLDVIYKLENDRCSKI